jgi:hypothetical protein
MTLLSFDLFRKDRTSKKMISGKKRSLRMEPLEDRQMLSIDSIGVSEAYAQALDRYDASVIGAAVDYSSAWEVNLSQASLGDLTTALDLALGTTAGNDLILIKGIDSVTSNAEYNKIKDFEAGNGVTIVWVGTTDSLTITKTGGTAARVFNISNNDGDVVLAGFDITGGSGTEGGGIYANNNANLVIASSKIHDNTAASIGGGIYAEATNLTLIGVDVTDNHVTNGYGGGVAARRTGSSQIGSLTIIDGTVSDNSATVIDSTYASDSQAYGGGIFASRLDTTIDGTTISGNTATGVTSATGGGLYLNNTGFGGTNDTSVFTITDAIINENISNGSGGGLSFKGAVTVEDTTFSGNDASQGGGIFGYTYDVNESATFDRVTVINNTAAEGAGVYIKENTSAVFVNSVIADNDASVAGGGLYVVLGVTGTGTSFNDYIGLGNVTLTGNTAVNGAGIYLDATHSLDAGDYLLVANSIVTDSVHLNGNTGDHTAFLSSLINESAFNSSAYYDGRDQNSNVSSNINIATLPSNYEIFRTDGTSPYDISQASVARGKGNAGETLVENFLANANITLDYKESIGDYDLAGKPRYTDDTILDLGAYQYVKTPAEIKFFGVALDPQSSPLFDGDSIYVGWQVHNIGESDVPDGAKLLVHYDIYRDGTTGKIHEFETETDLSSLAADGWVNDKFDDVPA